MLNRISIKVKFIFVFVVIFVAFIVVGAFSSVSLKQIGDKVENSYQNDTLSFLSVFTMNQSFNEMAIIAHEMQLTFDPDELNELNSEFVESSETLLSEAKSFKAKLDTTRKSPNTNTSSKISVEKYYTEVEAILNKSQEFISIVPDMVAAAKNEDSQGVADCDDLIMPLLDDIAQSMANLVMFSQTDVFASNESVHGVINNSIYLIIGMFITFFILGTIIAVLIIRSVTVPIAHLIEGAKKVASGDLHINMQSNGSDEISVLSNAFSQIIDVISGIIRDISQMSDKHKLGETDYVISADKYGNSFRELTEGLNEMVLEYVKESAVITDAIHHLAIGDFTQNIKNFPGKKAMVTDSVNDLKNQLYKLNNDITILSDKAAEGNLSERITESAYSGDWSKLVASLNKFLDRVSEPITETSHVLSEHAKGNLDFFVTGNYKGEFLNLKSSINSSSKAIHSYVAEISQTLKELENNDLNQKVTREYVGDFNIIKTALNNIFTKLNEVMREIGMSSDQVESGATQISKVSEELSEGSSTQAAAVSELTDIVENINKIAAENERYAKQADAISKESTQNANVGSKEMKDMLTAMRNINESSGNIQKIIKTIEDIAFQTNLLALNASVEAARAGQHGKGFAVVADEVRTLAGRSAVAAKETSDLITDSLSKIALGEKIAVSTDNALETIVNNVKRVSELISKITAASSEQSSALTRINEKLIQINGVVQNTSATAEETAAAAAELTAQSHKLNNLLLAFNLYTK